MAVFEKSKWIWTDCEITPDQYTEYLQPFFWDGESAAMRLSCDSDYTLFINGKYVASNQYGDFEHYKIFDTLDLTNHLSRGENEIKILVHYCGVETSRYKRAKAGLIYEILQGEKLVCASDEKVLSRLSPAYANGQQRFLTVQLGFTFSYDATKEQAGGYAPSVAVEKRVSFYPRPIPKQQVLPRCKIKEMKKQPFGYTVDFGKEVVGLVTLDFISKREQTITVAYGESLDDGRVRARIGARNFSFEYRAREGKNEFTNYMLRLSGRYLELICEEEIDLIYAGLLPQVYEVAEKPCKILDDKDRKIYDVCVNTLRLCMMEHYVDTPWREQALYSFDSRNQILCGYYAFEKGNRDYVRASLALLGEDRRADGLLSICAPSGITLTIPSFSLHYIIAVSEYLQYCGDVEFVKQYAPRMKQILDAVLHNFKDGLALPFIGADYWNFYDWVAGVDGGTPTEPDLILNCLLVLALDAYEQICAAAGLAFAYVGVSDALREKIKEEFCSGGALLCHRKGDEDYTVLGNSLAVLCGVLGGEQAHQVCEQIVQGKARACTLSMNIWKYDALLKTDEEKYKEFILKEIRDNYQVMLDAGATTVWETLDGAKAFDNAGSLCHGWTAVPVYIFHRLGVAKKEE